MKFVKVIVIPVILALTMVGCSSSSKHTIYDKNGNPVQTVGGEAYMLSVAEKVVMACETSRQAMATAASAGIKMSPGDLKEMSPQFQQEYADEVLPMLILADVAKTSITRQDAVACQSALKDFYRYKTMAKQSNNGLIGRALGILGVLGGAYLIGNSSGSETTINNSGGSSYGGSVNTAPPTIVDPVVVEIPAP